MKKIIAKGKVTKVVIISAGVFLLGIVFYVLLRPKPVNYEYAVADKGTIIQQVSATGKVKASQNVDLSFERTGRVNKINALAGAKVKAGDIIATLDSSDLYASLSQAQASVKVAEANLLGIESGTRVEDISVSESQVASAERSASDSANNLSEKISDAYTASDDIIRNKLDVFYTSSRNTPALNFSPEDITVKLELESDRVSAEKMLASWKSDIDLGIVAANPASYSSKASDNMSFIISYLNRLAFAVNDLQANNSLSSATIDSWKSIVSSARSSAASARASLSIAEDSYNSASTSLSIYKNQLTLKRSGATPAQLSASRASVDSAKASVQSIAAQISKGVMRSPITGVIARNDLKIGEVPSMASASVSVISSGRFEIETFIPEADIPKISVGESANITLDAYGSDNIFEAKVASIDPGETVSEGVTTYRAIVEFVKDDPRIRSGLTANIDILSGQKDDVITIPQRAVVLRNSVKIVRVIGKDGSVKDVPVKTGMRGIDGKIEIIEGVNAGDLVITSAI